MKIAVVLPGGVDRSGERRVIPAFLALLRRLAASAEVHVFPLAQEQLPGSWTVAGAKVHNVGSRATALRLLAAVRAEHGRGAFDLVQSLFSGNNALLALLVARILRVPLAVHVAGGELVGLRDIGYGGGLDWIGRIRERLVLRAADAVTAASRPMIDLLSSVGVEAGRLPLGVDLSTWPARAPRRRDVTLPVRLIHIASLNRVKDQTTLLRCLAQVATRGVEFHLDIVGEDTLGGEIQALCARLGLDRCVRFHGFLTQTGLRPLIELSDIALISSCHEAGPLTVLEAAVAGVPTVGTRVGHIAEWAPHAAVAVPVGDADAMADAICALIADEDRRLKLATAAQALALEENADFTGRQFVALHSRLCRLER
jgi:glycosyltransferase involved in cell wall biosynthesis